MDNLSGLVTYKCPENVYVRLVAPVSRPEIYEALYSLPNDKVFGPDGYTKEFFVAAWPVISIKFIIA